MTLMIIPPCREGFCANANGARGDVILIISKRFIIGALEVKYLYQNLDTKIDGDNKK